MDSDDWELEEKGHEVEWLLEEDSSVSFSKEKFLLWGRQDN